MKKKKIIIYSSIIVLIVLTIILFTTYAFITTKVSGNSSGKKYQAISKIIRIEYSDGKETLSSNINDTFTPGSVITKTFTVTNTGDDDIDYTICLKNVINTFTRINDITYELYDSSNTKIYEGIFPKTDNTISDTYKLKKNESTTYTLKVIYNNSEENQIVDSGKKIDAKISFVGATLKNTILASAKKGGENRTTMGTTKTEFTAVSGANDRLLNNAPDDYGTSYYYYGAVTDNYVSFADKLWRIVRINGDGTIRLVLDDVAKDTSGSVIKTVFNSKTDDNAYVGYMYGTLGSASYDDTHKNINDSIIKTKVDAWYKTNIVDTNNSDYVADTLFCNDKTLASNGIGGVATQLGYGTNKTYYAVTERLYYSTGTTSITTSKPTFKCAENGTNDYSRFTVNVSTLSDGNKTNGKLTYPVGLLTADEVAYAGAYKSGQTNKTYYLYNSSISSYWWLLSPYIYIGSYAREFSVYYPIGSLSVSDVFNSCAFRPSINLKAETLKNAGDGTKENPYTVKIS